MTIRERPLILPANTQIEGELLVHLPVILEKDPVVQFLVFMAVLIGVTSRSWIAQLQRGQSVTCGRASNRRVGSLREPRGKAEGGRRLIIRIPPVERELVA